MSIKSIAFLLLFTLVCFQVQADMPLAIKDPEALIDNEIARLDTLIQATEQSLQAEKHLRAQIVDYQKVQKEYLNAPHNNDLLLKVVKAAYRTLHTIKENHLAQTFDTDFIDELTVLSQPATKRCIPKP